MGNNRILGFDILRSFSIVSVVGYHASVAFPLRLHFAVLGVEMFFTLSGFLICQMIFERFATIDTPGALKAFYLNRWMRTFPLYYLFLAIYALISVYYTRLNPDLVDVPVHLDTLPNLWPFVFFAQNVYQDVNRYNSWFGVSWTLSLEEWFYLLLPLCFLISRGTRSTQVMIALSMAAISLCIAARLGQYALDPVSPGMDTYRRAIIYRLDAFCYGGLIYLAMLRRRSVIERHKRLLLLAGILVVLISSGFFFVFQHHPELAVPDAFMKLVYYSLVPAGFALILPYFFGLSLHGEVAKRIFYWLSTRTYSLYLSHPIVLFFFWLWLGPPTLSTLWLYFTAAGLVSEGLYRFIERPILRRRPHMAMSQTGRNAYGILPVTRASISRP